MIYGAEAKTTAKNGWLQKLSSSEEAADDLEPKE